mgnify:CR=1 FL=1
MIKNKPQTTEFTSRPWSGTGEGGWAMYWEKRKRDKNSNLCKFAKYLFLKNNVCSPLPQPLKNYSGKLLEKTLYQQARSFNL